MGWRCICWNYWNVRMACWNSTPINDTTEVCKAICCLGCCFILLITVSWHQNSACLCAVLPKSVTNSHYQSVTHRLSVSVSDAQTVSFSQWRTNCQFQSVTHKLSVLVSDAQTVNISQWRTNCQYQSVTHKLSVSVSDTQTVGICQWHTTCTARCLSSGSWRDDQTHDVTYIRSDCLKKFIVLYCCS